MVSRYQFKLEAGTFYANSCLQIEDPLAEATKYLKLLQNNSSSSLETHILSFELNMRKQKILLAFQVHGWFLSNMTSLYAMTVWSVSLTKKIVKMFLATSVSMGLFG